MTGENKRSVSLCHQCQHVRRIESGRGSIFWLCQLAVEIKRMPKYPPQPVVQCQHYQAVGSRAK